VAEPELTGLQVCGAQREKKTGTGHCFEDPWHVRNVDLLQLSQHLCFVGLADIEHTSLMTLSLWPITE